MRRSLTNGGRGRAERRPRPGGESAWPLRLCFVGIGAALVVCWWLGAHAMQGKVSFAWVGSLQQEVQAVASPLRGRGAIPPTPTPGDRYVSPLAQAASPTASPAARPERATVAPTATTLAASAPASAIPRPEPTATPDPLPPSPTASPRATASPVRSAQPEATSTAVIDRADATAQAEATVVARPHVTYVVQAGDTLYAIARRHGTSVGVLAEINHLQAPYKLLQGMRLLLPAT